MRVAEARRLLLPAGYPRVPSVDAFSFLDGKLSPFSFPLTQEQLVLELSLLQAAMFYSQQFRLYSTAACTAGLKH